MNIYSIFSIFLPSTDELNIPFEFEVYYTYNGQSVSVGDDVEVETSSFGWQIGRIDRIVPNPFWRQSGMTAYVAAKDDKGWTEYASLEIEVY